mmetsp:Transcript_65934/g.204086  ORF Transcript_65934/g.204086 Transcript_65934/m.204086 type:complete len:222 (+) Transcript_65934:162-827(+)
MLASARVPLHAGGARWGLMLAGGQAGRQTHRRRGAGRPGWHAQMPAYAGALPSQQPAAVRQHVHIPPWLRVRLLKQCHRCHVSIHGRRAHGVEDQEPREDCCKAEGLQRRDDLAEAHDRPERAVNVAREQGDVVESGAPTGDHQGGEGEQEGQGRRRANQGRAGSARLRQQPPEDRQLRGAQQQHLGPGHHGCGGLHPPQQRRRRAPLGHDNLLPEGGAGE